MNRKIVQLRTENVKRIKVAEINPDGSLIIIEDGMVKHES